VAVPTGPFVTARVRSSLYGGEAASGAGDRCGNGHPQGHQVSAAAQAVLHASPGLTGAVRQGGQPYAATRGKPGGSGTGVELGDQLQP
jgi:hypothetical protein